MAIKEVAVDEDPVELVEIMKVEKVKVVVVGGGFGGINVVRGLKDTTVDILLFDRHNYHLFQPLLYQVATAELEPAAIATPIRQILKNQANVIVGLTEVERVDLERRLIHGHRGAISYDYLVIATGVQPSYFGHEEYKPHAPGLKSIDDAHAIRQRILVAFEAAEWEADEEARRAKLTFVVVGGGPTGVELAGAIMDAARYSLPKDFRRIHTESTRVILIDGGSRLVKTMPETASRRIQADLEKMGVEIHLNTRVTAVDEHGVLAGVERIEAENVFWAAGIQGTPLVKTLGVQLDRAGRVHVGPDMSVPGYPNVFVIGDAAAAQDAKTGQPVPGVAQGAIQTGKFVAEIIRQEVQNGPKTERPTFSYFDKGSMAMIGRGKGVTSIGKRTFGGFLGFLAWSGLHIMFLVGFRRKIIVSLVWLWNYIRHERGARIITGSPDAHMKKIVDLEVDDGDSADEEMVSR